MERLHQWLKVAFVIRAAQAAVACTETADASGSISVFKNDIYQMIADLSRHAPVLMALGRDKTCTLTYADGQGSNSVHTEALVIV